MTTFAKLGTTPANWSFMTGHPARLVALSFGLGLIPLAPGTFGTLLAFPLFWALAPSLTPWTFLGLWLALAMVGVAACERTGRDLGAPDHPAMVWDETVAFLLVLFFTPDEPRWQAWAFMVFRFMDIVKPPPIRALERRLGGGLGVMADDLLAAFYALLPLAAWKTWVM